MTLHHFRSLLGRAGWLVLLGTTSLHAAVLQPQGTLVTAHRGWLDPAGLENDIMQIAATTAAGPFMVEFDLKPSADGTLYLLHDDSLQRVSDGHGAIADQPDAALALMHRRTSDGHASQRPLSRYAELLQWAKAAPTARLMLDVKKLPPASYLPALLAAGLGPRSVVLSFDPASASALQPYARQVLVSVLVTSNADVDRYRRQFGDAPLAMYVPEDAAPALFAAAHASGAVVISDAIMDKPQGSLDQRAERGGDAVYRDYLAQRPIDILVSNHPQRLQRLLHP